MRLFKSFISAMFLLFMVIVAVITLSAPIMTHSEALQATIDSQVVLDVSSTERYGDWRSFPVLLNGSDAQNEKIKYAWEISHYDIDFIYTLNGENGLWTHDRIHDSSANTVGVDMGFGINSYFHPQIVSDTKFWNDWKWNIDRTYQLYAGNVTFYGHSTKGIRMI